MAPIPLEGGQTPITGNMASEGNKGGSISLAMLIDFIVQRAYHEITVLAELLPRKSDMERKIEIYNYASKTRQQFVRLLALVKWANSASKVDKSMHIMTFLEKQSMLFIDTADVLSRTARETVVRARLPNFLIPAAAEVLTTGSYSRVPSCIKDRIVPSVPVTPEECQSTLLRLNQVIQHRLVSTTLLPQMQNLKIEFGRVIFHVEREFNVSLTLMGDGPDVPWRLLDIEILVRDKEIGEGAPLVHSLQIQYIHDLLQAKIAAGCVDPLKEVYMFLHSFCLSLQLEVLCTQLVRLSKDRLQGHIHIDEYFPNRSLVVSYWRELSLKDANAETVYAICLQVDPKCPEGPLNILHTPRIGDKEKVIFEDFRTCDVLCIERLLVHTIYIRAKKRLKKIVKALRVENDKLIYSLKGRPVVVLAVCLLVPCVEEEKLLVTVDTHTGMIRCHIPLFITQPIFINDLENTLNSKSTPTVTPILKELRYLIGQQRCIQTLQHLPVTVVEKLPLLYSNTHPISKIDKHRMFVTFYRHLETVLAVEMKDSTIDTNALDYRYHVINVRHSTIEETAESHSSETEVSKLYLRVLSCHEYKKYLALGPFTVVEDEEEQTNEEFRYTPHKRKLEEGEEGTILPEVPRKRFVRNSFIIPQLSNIVSACDERTSYSLLAEELTRRNIKHQGIQVEATSTALCLKVMNMPLPPAIRPGIRFQNLMDRTLSVAFRVVSKGTNQFWNVEYILYGSPVAVSGMHSREQARRRTAYFQYDMNSSLPVAKVIDSFLSDWSRIAHLYHLVEDFVDEIGKNDIGSIASVKCFTYMKLVIAYGPGRQATVTVRWLASTNSFSVLFGSTSTAVNPHTLLKEQLEDLLNKRLSLAQLIITLHETYQPLLSLSKLPGIPQLCVLLMKPNMPILTFALIARSTTMVRLIYQGTYCLEITFRGDNVVYIRDGAFSKFDRTAVLSEYVPAQGLKAFLSKYEDETSALKRISTSEDDNPPSPVRADSMIDSPSSFLGTPSHHRSPQSPAQRESSGLRFHAPLTPPSNPHTPASPHTNVGQVSQHQAFNSPAASFSMASSPPSSSINPSPSMLPHPSPGSSLLASSPSNPLHAPSPAGLMQTSSPGSSSANIPVGHSPAGFLSQSSHMEGSPFPSQSMTSPANWPNSPGIPRPSPARQGQSPSAPGGHSMMTSPDHKVPSIAQITRVLPQKTWAGAVPTVISHDALDILCTPVVRPPELSEPGLSPLERFLGCGFLRRQVQRCVQTEECYTLLNAEPGVIHFKAEGLQYRIYLNQHDFLSLHLKVTPLPESKDPWNPEDLQILEKFFESRAAAPPYKPHSIIGFLRFLSCSHFVLRDLIQIMKLDLVPSLVQQQQLKWSVQWCLRIPPSAFPIVPVGMVSVIICKAKILFFLNITRVGSSYSSVNEVPSFVLPLMYDSTNNVTQVAEKRDTSGGSLISLASMHIKRFSEFNVGHNECSIFPVVRDLLMNFTLPSESQQATSPASGGPSGGLSPMMVNVPQIQQAGSPMVHSPMIQQSQQPATPPVPPPTMMNTPPSGLPPSPYPVGMTPQQHGIIPPH